MTSRFDSQLTPQRRWPSSAICGVVLLCLAGQSILPGITISHLPATGQRAETAGCCVVDLSRAAQPGCCCGPTSGKSCGCACGTGKSSTTITNRDRPSSEHGRSIESEICGCGGEHRPGMITSIDPAVVAQIDEPLQVRPEPQFPDVKLARCECALPPPTPPPESCV